ncbi:hypothetical protein [Corynebacterium tuberculostearicum]|uniref:Uncharacterized protein n=1 Tax=Corynebacterium tuberculostearicum SK141 TaxID=553206 RepID=C6R6Y9_9CORY|nr:hypothetical protein [Corynebacterium tuberculostearicum]EET78415.1 hypothetical protein CORTU0001_1282 [Corynebacterium tuberculostearicum SK141]
MDRQPLLSKLSSWGTDLHMGIMIGLPLQVTLLGITLAAFLILDVILIHTPRQKKLVNAIT